MATSNANWNNLASAPAWDARLLSRMSEPLQWLANTSSCSMVGAAVALLKFW